MTNKNEDSHTLVRVAKSTHRLLMGMQKRDKETKRVSADAAIRWMWGRMCQQAIEIKKLKKQLKE